MNVLKVFWLNVSSMPCTYIHVSMADARFHACSKITIFENLICYVLWFFASWKSVTNYL